jgi:uncharacterized membrane protein (UPF0127 family)
MTAFPISKLAMIPRCAAVLLLGVMMAGTGCHPQQADSGERTQAVTLAGEHFTLDLALDDQARFHGLSDVKDIPEHGGMLFVFAEPQQLNFVMRKCLVPIDLIYLGPGGRIVSTHKMAVVPYDTPEEQLKWYSSGWPAQFVLELRQGSIDRLKLKTGQKIDLPLAQLKARAR